MSIRNRSAAPEVLVRRLDEIYTDPQGYDLLKTSDPDNPKLTFVLEDGGVSYYVALLHQLNNLYWTAKQDTQP